MFSVEDRCGVMGDYDLAPPADRARARGADRIQVSTIPFMATNFEPHEYHWPIKHRYHHELEALIWVLPFVFLRYQNGAAVPNTIVEEWTTLECHCVERISFLSGLREHEKSVQPDFKDVWPVAFKLLCWVLMKPSAGRKQLDRSHARASFAKALESVPHFRKYPDNPLKNLRPAPPESPTAVLSYNSLQLSGGDSLPPWPQDALFHATQPGQGFEQGFLTQMTQMNLPPTEPQAYPSVPPDPLSDSPLGMPQVPPGVMLMPGNQIPKHVLNERMASTGVVVQVKYLSSSFHV